MRRSISSTGGNLSPLFVVVVVVVAAAAVLPGAAAYKNYTVGDDKGWYDGLTLPGVDYQEWADGKNFSLGDFLIFNTDKNHSVVQTRNETLYKSCDYNDSGPDDTVEWSAAAPEFSKDAVTVAVPLLREGGSYFFSGNYDGEQCENGQRFAITVAHGQGLPPDLRPPAAEAPGPSSSASGAAGAPPAAFDFSHPKNVSSAPADMSTTATPDGDDDDAAPSTSGAGQTLAGLGSGLLVVAATALLLAVVQL
ncbi:blue copper protein-like [Oryza brachyantha]|uniref:blue copper protein-like n=1 Tax=Oryza brachyantha TaxID=4533 RepID=UPI001ADBBE1C|nr:blue copper protein-like [Oryza brachyantha]